MLALYCIGAELTAGVVQLAGLGAVEKVVEKWWPTTEAEVLSKPRFIHDRALDDAQSSLRLADREQRRLLEILSRCLDAVRQGATPGPLHEAAKEVLNRIKEFLEDLAALYPGRSVDDHVPMLTRQRLLFWLDERVLELCRVLDAMPRQSTLEAWRMGLVEGLDAVLLTLHDTLSTNDEDSWELTARLIDDRGELDAQDEKRAPEGRIRPVAGRTGGRAPHHQHRRAHLPAAVGIDARVSTSPADECRRGHPATGRARRAGCGRSGLRHVAGDTPAHADLTV